MAPCTVQGLCNQRKHWECWGPSRSTSCILTGAQWVCERSWRAAGSERAHPGHAGAEPNSVLVPAQKPWGGVSASPRDWATGTQYGFRKPVQWRLLANMGCDLNDWDKTIYKMLSAQPELKPDFRKGDRRADRRCVGAWLVRDGTAELFPLHPSA